MSIISTFIGLPYISAPLTQEMSLLGSKTIFRVKMFGLMALLSIFMIISSVFVLTFGRRVLTKDSILKVMYHESSELVVGLAEAAFVITLITNIPYFAFMTR